VERQKLVDLATGWKERFEAEQARRRADASSAP
jgi:hypothetical protein